MKIVLISVGTMRETTLEEIVDKFRKRLGHYIPFEYIEVPDSAGPRNKNNETARKAKDCEAILSKIVPGDFVVILDERGRELTSRQLSSFIEEKAAMGTTKRLVFVVGGPYGFSPDMYARADMQLCLSKLTFTHEFARAVIMEQLYRAMTIIKGEPYHHD